MTARLRAVPWHALDGIQGLLDAPLREILDGAAAERVLDKFLRAHRGFSADERSVSAESLFGVGLWRRRLRAHLPDATPLQLLDVLVTVLGERPRPGLPPLAPTPTDWRDLHSIPDWIAEHVLRAYGEDASKFAETINVPGPVCLRARGPRDELKAKLAAHGIETRDGRRSPHALIVTSPQRPNLYGLPPAEFLGTYEVQDEGSQLLSLFVGAQPGEDVLELCAGAGGKSLHLAAIVGPRGRVHACDIDLPRLERLRTRASQANARVLIQGREPPAGLRVPRVFIDAPCSELGSLRRGPDLRWRLKPELVAESARTQHELITRGLKHVAPGGTLTYATCTITHEENEGLIARIRSEHPTLTVERTLKVDPHVDDTDGFRAFVLKR
ncbi:MAG: RsmB/NOP family class I SAM-dependent RNA methyltransferase [Archangium sp.]|nr:RsmB/NOP family class I SAM-dependent RNA methyltransferase [Archangium sp.]